MRSDSRTCGPSYGCIQWLSRPHCSCSGWMYTGRCFTGVDPVLDSDPKFIAIDEEANDQIVHRDRFGEANGATYETLDAGPQIDMFTFDCLRMLFPNVMLLWGNMPLVG